MKRSSQLVRLVRVLQLVKLHLIEGLRDGRKGGRKEGWKEGRKEGRNERGMWGQGSKGWDQGTEGWDQLGSQPRMSDHTPLDRGSGCTIYVGSGTTFCHAFWNQGSEIWVKKFGSLMKKHTSLRTCYVDDPL